MSHSRIKAALFTIPAVGTSIVAGWGIINISKSDSFSTAALQAWEITGLSVAAASLWKPLGHVVVESCSSLYRTVAARIHRHSSPEEDVSLSEIRLDTSQMENADDTAVVEPTSTRCENFGHFATGSIYAVSSLPPLFLGLGAIALSRITWDGSSILPDPEHQHIPNPDHPLAVYYAYLSASLLLSTMNLTYSASVEFSKVRCSNSGLFANRQRQIALDPIPLLEHDRQLSPA